ncbi:MAG: M48 family metallopeptidase [Holophaga sp.]|nr:M48 family metallopeptidase [Holophaga sp.]
MRTQRMLLPAMLFPAALVAGDRVQAPDAAWKTYPTPHYRIHFPANPSGGFQPFAEEIASKIEGIHAKVTEWVGHEAKGPIDVVLRDPVLEANGMAVPLLKRPFVELWKTPPEAEDAIGHFTTWVDLLVVHELTHIHHMMWPQNRPRFWDKVLDLPIGPVANKAPRWVTEGYATLIEGRITGSGRPHGAYRAAVIRQWALQGKLPSYGAVSGMGGFRGGSMAYLIGSAYLEWLERQNAQDPDILKKFWKQLASRKRRDFEPSFRATFGIAALDGYDRWRAEVTHDALALERRAKAEGLIREGELFTRINGEVTDLAVSPDGTKLLARVLSKAKPGIQVWDLAAKPEEKKKTEKKETPDPNEVEDRKPEYPEPTPLAIIRRRNGILPRHAWWTAPEQITFEMRKPNGEGVLEPTFLMANLKSRQVSRGRAPEAPKATPFGWKELDGTWNLVKTGPDGQVQRLTRTLSAAWQPAPTPDGKALYYVQLSATGCEIRKLDLSLPPLEDKPLPLDTKPLVPRTLFSPADEPNLLPPSSKPPVAQDYSIWSTHYSGSRVGYILTPSGEGTQIGWGGNDLLGRFNWHVLGGVGQAMGPRGATLGVAYRGWRFAPSLEVFSSLERPSRQSFAPIAGWDRERRGAELAFTFLQQGTFPEVARVVLASERLEFLGTGTALTRSLAGLGWTFAQSRSRGEDWGMGLRGTLHAAGGRTDGHGWNLTRGELSLRLRTPVGAFSAKAETGRVNGSPTALDRFHLGSQATSLVPGSLDWNRVEQVALPAYTQIGDRMQRLRGEFSDGWRLYLEHAVVWDQTQLRPRHQRVVGAELPVHEMMPANLAEMLLGRFTFTLGLHRTLDGVMKDRTVGTFTLVLRP